jgi:hypothetical protein
MHRIWAFTIVLLIVALTPSRVWGADHRQNYEELAPAFGKSSWPISAV